MAVSGGISGSHRPTATLSPSDAAASTDSEPAELRRASWGPAWGGRIVVTVAVLGAVVGLLATGRRASTELIATQWQLADLRALSDDPIRTLWYLHTQPPGYNAFVGLIAWSPLPLAGTLFALNAAALLGIGLVLRGIVVRLGAGEVASGIIASFAVLSPPLLGALHRSHYEILVAFMLIAGLACAQRFLESGRLRWFLLCAALITACGLIRTLFHPLWVIAAIAFLVIVRPVPRRVAIVTICMPVVVFGGWMLKNLAVFDVATTSSWLGFNLQRGVIASMDDETVRADVANGTVSPLALEYPWGPIEQYEPWVGECDPIDHPTTAWPEKEPYGGVRIANFNHQCYLAVYDQAQDDAVRLIREHPGRYLSTRTQGLVATYQVAWVGSASDVTWLDRAYGPVLLVREVELRQDDWNLPLLGYGPLPVEISCTLLGLSVFVAGRGALAALRLVRAGWRQRHRWPAHEVVWLLVAATTAVVVVGGCLLEFGENGRFRSSLDPLLIALPLGWAVVAVRDRWRRRDSRPTDERLDGLNAG